FSLVNLVAVESTSVVEDNYSVVSIAPGLPAAPGVLDEPNPGRRTTAWRKIWPAWSHFQPGSLFHRVLRLLFGRAGEVPFRGCSADVRPAGLSNRDDSCGFFRPINVQRLVAGLRTKPKPKGRRPMSMPSAQDNSHSTIGRMTSSATPVKDMAVSISSAPSIGRIPKLLVLTAIVSKTCSLFPAILTGGRARLNVKSPASGVRCKVTVIRVPTGL